jgi:hypothetical protein
LAINSVSIETISEYELGLRIGLASYRVGFGVIGSDPLRYVGAHPAKHWAAVAGYWAAWRVASWAEPVDRLCFAPLG